MKVLLYKGKVDVEKSGVGKAVKHQERALSLAKVPYTLDEKDDWDIVHINTIFHQNQFLYLVFCYSHNNLCISITISQYYSF